MMPTITINADLCTRCGICVPICWPSVYVQETKDSIPEVINAGSCISCGHCVAICPGNAIVHSVFPAGYAKPVISKNIPSSEEVLELMRTRRSTRFFKEIPVERHLIERIIEAARFAPSYLNLQTTQFIVVRDRELLKNIIRNTSQFIAESVAKLHNPFLRRILSIKMQVPAGVIAKEVLPHFDYVVAEIRKGRDLVLYNAPVLLLFHAEKKPFSSADINARLALQNAALMAYAQGLGSSYSSAIMQVCERDKSVRPLVKLPENHRVYGALAIGYPKFEFKKWPERRKPEITWL